MCHTQRRVRAVWGGISCRCETGEYRVAENSGAQGRRDREQEGERPEEEDMRWEGEWGGGGGRGGGGRGGGGRGGGEGGGTL